MLYCSTDLVVVSGGYDVVIHRYHNESVPAAISYHFMREGRGTEGTGGFIGDEIKGKALFCMNESFASGQD